MTVSLFYFPVVKLLQPLDKLGGRTHETETENRTELNRNNEADNSKPNTVSVSGKCCAALFDGLGGGGGVTTCYAQRGDSFFFTVEVEASESSHILSTLLH